MKLFGLNKSTGGALAAAAGSAFLIAACAHGRVVPVAFDPVPAFDAAFEERGEDWRRADSLWPGRHDPEVAWSALDAYRAAADEQPEVAAVWTRYAHAAYFVATYTETRGAWINPERRRALYREGARAAESALRLHPEYARVLAQTGDENAAVREVGDAWLQPAFWMAVNRGRQALAEGPRARIAGRERLEAFMRSLGERNGALHHGGPHRFLGAMYASTPEGRNADSARAHFTRAQRLAPLYFSNHTLRAEYLAVLENDSASFRQLLEWVTIVPADTLPEAAIENGFEQERARDLLLRQAEFFP